MIFAGTLYDVKYPRISRNNLIALTSLIALGIIILLRNLPFFSGSRLLYFIVPILLVFPILRFYAWFSIEEHSKTELGPIIFSPDGLIFDREKIAWDSITKITVMLIDFKRNYEDKGRANYSNNRSAGVRNKLIVEVNGSEIIRGNLFLSSQQDMDLLKRVLWEVVEKNRLPLAIAKSLINPESYEEHQQVKRLSRL